ncbi:MULTISPECIES: isochorismate synthase [Brenneria]|uniref:isochorismate synthase n=1 Tax=Brenneria nigrifluens DSM 30175 = ATCC 13028 TaxID=1121120 RepID=A0A2U1UP88_9GAMM|nr:MULTISPECIES: isochorismate synthase [Brenneria]EHD23305.1 isochorismate synthase [Brenneria sp. EniD312]PWC23490.1 isochorismate synthase [Brenneria nigrifluens] [Brenneria nigrifluens DSM 30175 = ATCC 13028]QCR06237.1 isochorismate synthase [Brenneria nigrifluens] [Brenneria nigrifluens DSM 30175 = ATCC 13028]
MGTPFHHHSFLFSSAFRSLYTEGVFKTLTWPASDPSALCQKVAHGFEQARLAGITRPIVVGAIPFDVRQPSSLYIPHACHFLSREAFKQKLSATPQTPLRIVDQQPHPQREYFLAMVESAVNAIRQGELQKIVLSRLQSVQVEHPLNTIALLATLAEQNPNGYYFHLPLAEKRYLFGASPELLLRQQGRSIWSTPLAGTAKRAADERQDRDSRDRLLTSRKDRHEHQLVIEEIRQTLAGYCSSLSIPPQPELLPTPNLWHLASPIAGELKADNSQSLSLAGLLHPTPALCGVPKEKARRLISELEPFERGVFGGIVGWSDDEGNGEWAVTIRCGISQQQHIQLYAGAGIVADSDPAAEWLEIEAKMRTMLRALGQ